MAEEPDEHAASDELIRVAIYRGFAATGRCPTASELARAAAIEVVGILPALQRLAAHRHVVLGDEGDVVMAHPFCARNLGFSVMGQGTLWWGGCAWDSFALPHLVPAEPEVLVATRCPACGTPHAILVERDRPPKGDEVAHFLVPMDRAWDDVIHTCGNQRVFCNEACVSDWLAATGHGRGCVMDLHTLWRLAAHWYDGRLDEGYRRREPSEAAEYFASVGLVGQFWGS